MKTTEGDSDASMEMTFQVVDVSKALLSVHRVCEQGHAGRVPTVSLDHCFLGSEEEEAVVKSNNECSEKEFSARLAKMSALEKITAVRERKLAKEAKSSQS